jgi:AraC-like DNA-binding protein
MSRLKNKPKKMDQETFDAIQDVAERHPFQTVKKLLADYGMTPEQAGRFSARTGLAKMMRESRTEHVREFVSINPTLSVAAYARHFGTSEGHMHKLFEKLHLKRW